MPACRGAFVSTMDIVNDPPSNGILARGRPGGPGGNAERLRKPQ